MYSPASGAKFPQQTNTMTRPNILWIYCDELRPDGLGCYPMRDCPDFPRFTPHLDRMAAEGVRFTRHYCNSPICVSSRSCILTANYCEQHGVYCNEGAWPAFRSPQLLPTLPVHFAKNGYATANFGKTHVPHDWRCWEHDNPEGGDMGFWRHLGEEGVAMIRAQRPGSSRPGGMVGGCYPDSEPYPPRRVVDNALHWLDQQEHQTPWFARISLLQPHTPVLPPARFRDLYDGLPWTRPQTVPEGVSTFQKRIANNYLSFPPERMAQAARDYYALCAWVDSEVGRVLAHVRERGDAERTIVVFTADHGCHMGEQGLNEKHSFVPGVHGVPFLLRWTGTLPGGRVDESVSESVDLARTLCDLAGVTPATSFRGRSLLSDPAPEAVFATIGFGAPGGKMGPNGGVGDWLDGRGWPRRTCVRTQRYRYDRNVMIDGVVVGEPDWDPFLADTESDPAETINLAHDPAYANVRAHLETLLLRHVAQAIAVDPACLIR